RPVPLQWETSVLMPVGTARPRRHPHGDPGGTAMPVLPSALDTVLRRCAVAGTAALLLPPALAGCGGAESAPGGAGDHRADIGAADRARVADGGTLRWAVDALPRTLNSFQADASA